MISYNSSTLSEVSFDSWIAASNPHGFDASFHGAPVFPAAAILEIACACGVLAGERRICGVADVIWPAPLNLRNDAQLIRTFVKRIGDSIEYAVASRNESGKSIVNSSGRLVFTSPAASVEAGLISVKALKSQCMTLDAESHYQRLEARGLGYGYSLRSVQELYVCDTFSLSKLVLADTIDHGNNYILHPAIMEGAFQTAIALLDACTSDISYAPFALEELTLIRRVPSIFYAYARLVDSIQSSDLVKSFDIRLCNESGETLAEMKGLTMRALQSSEEGTVLSAENESK
jgi:polyketide synthase PksL